MMNGLAVFRIRVRNLSCLSLADYRILTGETQKLNYSSRIRTELILLAAFFSRIDYLNVGIARKPHHMRLRDTQREAYRTLYSEVNRRLGVKSSSSNKRKTVLEVGCGLSAAKKDGLFVDEVLHEAIDISLVAVAISRLRGLKARNEDIRFQSAASNSYDAIIGVECLCAFPGPVRAQSIKEITRVLAPSGLLITLDFFPIPQSKLPLHLEREYKGTGLKIIEFKNLTDYARAAVMGTHEERSSIFAALPRPIRRSAFGRGIQDTMSLEGSKRYTNWVENKRSYGLTIAQKIDDEN